MKIFRNRGFRWILLMLGLAAIIALTGMNVFSLYDMRDRMVEDEQQKRIDQLDEIYRTIHNEIYAPTTGLYKLELENIEAPLSESGQFQRKIMDVLEETSKSNIFNGLYYTPYGTDPCNEDVSIYQYDEKTKKIILTSDYPEPLCDGVGLVRTKAKVRLNDLDYRWNTTTEFDANRSMNIGLININESRVIGYFTFIFDDEYIINEFISPMLTEYFGDSKETGVVVWLQNWVSKEVLATNASDVEYDRDLVNYRHSFSSFFSNWSIKLAFTQTPVASAYTATLVKNLVVLGVAVLFLMGALIFMFVTAQRERSLAQRQASFLANVTHELKTPLAVMQAAGENISDGRVMEPTRLKQYGEHIYKESIRLRSMIEKLLDVAKADSGQTIVKPAPHRLHDLMMSYIKENKEYIEDKGFEMVFESKDPSSVCMIDSNSFDTMISNLTENALKYSVDSKYIKYTVNSDKDNIFVSIQDHGIGIPRKALKNIYNKFYRVEDSLSAKTKGHGLGLSIVKNMVELNGGEINVKSSLGKGTKFTICFPKLMKQENSLKQEKNRITSDQNILEHTEHV